MREQFEYSGEKNELLIIKRGIGFERIIDLFETDDFLDDLKHPNQKKYPKQRMFLFKINKYVYVVPYVFDIKRNTIFLKTIYPNRKYTKKYLKK